MALVDSLLKLMSAQGADVLVIPSTEPPWLERRGEPRPLSMPALGRDMVDVMIEDLLDAPAREQLAAGQPVETVYEAEDGHGYAVLAEPRSDGPRLTLRRAGAELAAPSSAPMPAEPGPPAFPAAPSDPEPPLEAPASSSIPPAANHPPSQAPVVFTSGAGTPLEPLRSEPLLDPGPLGPVLVQASQERASDILLSQGSNARLRVAGEITELAGLPIDEPMIRGLVHPVLGPRAQHELNHAGSTDLALRIRIEGQVQRYRANLFLQQSGLALALRPVRADPPTLDVLNLPAELATLATLDSGLVLMTGTAGSGKSTTLVALIEHINRTAPKHVITLEDPIEYEYRHRRALVHQRQLGVHVSSFSEGLRAALRESPDVILVGEMRDHATVAAALTAAETGHLVLSTLHAADATMALDRIIDSFPEHQQAQIRFQLSGVLRAIVTQRLLPSRVLPQRVPAVELLRVNTAVATKIREGRGHQILSEIQKGRGDGMLSFEVTLAALVRRGLLATEAAMAHSSNPALMAEHLRGRG
ncbi:type IV pilus twitching motility protein PilT [Paraliomyxa miuraensis]|uniref:type IV pilus twitching motility protein PilT n=1 Tax=Paraliomyxa miuraensis TaxID=376150 RepID=UPI002254D4A7|nr:PilT/PilU family type 4a pilus ATPase [Paraliomyxa miuraensis]MCX4246020.1 PilT/PilU family type 4a pilus ATPase [Paraliomyxa miuraensis]